MAENIEAKPKKKKKHRLRKIILWFLGSIFTLIVLVILLLSVLFPSEYVKNKIVIPNLRSTLNRNVTIHKLKFNVFTGIKITGFQVYERKLFGSNKPFLKVKSLNVDYSLFSLIFGTFKLNEATLNGAEVYIESRKINGKVRYNFDDLAQVQSNAVKKEVEKPQTPKLPAKESNAGPPKMKKPSMPISFALGKVGIENAKINYRDYTNPILTAEYTVDKITALITNLTSGNNPFGLEGGLQVSFSEIKKGRKPKKNFNIFVGLKGKVKPFDKRGLLNPVVDLKFIVKDFLTESSFLQTAINNGMKLMLRKFIDKIDNELPQITADIKKQAQPVIDKKLKNVEKEIDKLRSSQGLSKKALIKEKQKNVKKFDKEIGPKIDKTINGLIAKTNSLPGPLKAKAVTELKKQKKTLRAKAKKEFGKQLDKIIKKADREYKKQIDNLKKTAKGQVNKLIEKAIKTSAKQLKKWAASLEKSGIGLGFLKGGIRFNKGTMGIHLNNWKLYLRDMNLVGSKLGLKGSVDYGIYTGVGKMDSTIIIDKSLDVLKLFKPFQKGNKIYLPIKLSFNQKTGEYKLNESPLSADQAKKFATDYAVGYVERLIGVSDDSTTSSKNVDKYKKMMENARKGNLKGALKLAGSSKIIEKYEKLAKVAKAAKKVKKIFKRFKKKKLW